MPHLFQYIYSLDPELLAKLRLTVSDDTHAISELRTYRNDRNPFRNAVASGLSKTPCNTINECRVAYVLQGYVPAQLLFCASKFEPES